MLSAGAVKKDCQADEKGSEELFTVSAQQGRTPSCWRAIRGFWFVHPVVVVLVAVTCCVLLSLASYYLYLAGDEALHVAVFKSQQEQLFRNSNFQSDSCDCFNNHNNNDQCCERILWRTHKFGTVLLGDLFANFRRSTTAPVDPTTSSFMFRVDTRPTPKSSNFTLPTTTLLDYRHVMVTRNWMDAIVSGYLYHKAGYECTIDFRGTPTHHSKHFDMERHYHNKFWDTPNYLTYHYNYNISFPPRHNRSLCDYLAQESEPAGIAVVVDLALSRWYKGVVAYHRLANHSERTMFLCYEDLVDPWQQESIYYRILNFLFPTNTTTTDWTVVAPMPGAMQQALWQQKKQQSQNQNQSLQLYEGGHSSSHDPHLRARLRSLVAQFDQQWCHGTVAKSNAIFGCGERQ